MVLERYREWITVYLKGCAMGCADAVPGVSGGTIALITGIYERLIDALTSVNYDKLERSLLGLKDRDLSEIRKILLEMDVPFLAVLGVGIMTAVVLVLRLIHYLLSNFTVPTYGFFFGLIAVSALVLYRGVDLSAFWSKTAAVTGFLLAFIVSGYGAGALGHSLPVVFLAGMIAVSAMVLPGISGSLFLIILGQYDYISAALTEFTDALVETVTTGNLETLTSSAPPIIVFISGAFVGLFSVVHVVKKSLEKFREATMAFLVSMVLGALRAPVVQVEEHLVERGTTWSEAAPAFLTAAVVGGVLILVLDSRTEGELEL